MRTPRREATNERRVVMFTVGHSEIGGAARRSRLIAQTLAARGWSVAAITRAGSLRRFVLSREGNVSVLEVPGFGKRRVGALLFYVLALSFGLLRGASAHAFIAMQLTSQAMVAAICSLVFRKPFVVLLTTGGSVSEIAYLSTSAFRGIRMRLLARARALIAQTEEAAEELRRFIPSASVIVMANPILATEPLPLNGRPAAAFAGRFSEEKDLLCLLNAWRRLVLDRPELSLTLVGAGGSYRSVEAQLRDKVSNDPLLARSVVFTGWVPEPAAVIGEADVFVFPSLSEGMSNALLEAMLLGRVIVASDIMPNRAILGDEYPLLFPAGDEEEMTAQMRAAFEDPDVRKVAVRHLESRRAKFSPDAFAEGIERLIDDPAHRARDQHPRGDWRS